MLLLKRFVACVLACAVSWGFVAPSALPVRRTAPAPRTQVISMGKMAKFGVASPAVYAGRVVLGDKRLEKIRKSFFCSVTSL